MQRPTIDILHCLPIEISQEILTYLPFPTLLELLRVNSTWNNIVNSHPVADQADAVSKKTQSITFAEYGEHYQNYRQATKRFQELQQQFTPQNVLETYAENITLMQGIRSPIPFTNIIESGIMFFLPNNDNKRKKNTEEMNELLKKLQDASAITLRKRQ